MQSEASLNKIPYNKLPIMYHVSCIMYPGVIQANNRVKYLCLSHNQFGEKGGQELAPAIGK